MNGQGYTPNQPVVEPTVVDKLIMVPTQQQHGVVQRQMHVSTTQHDINILDAMIHDTPSGRISEIDVANQLPTIMTMSNTPSRVIDIENGWDTKRFRFILITSTHKKDGGILRSYFQGYTNYADVSIGGLIDPRTRLTINSVINTMITFDPITNEPFTRILSAFNVIYNSLTKKFDIRSDNETLRLLRPTDVIKDSAYLMMSGAGENVINLDNRHASVPKASKAKNKIGSNHITSVLNALVIGKSSTDIGYDDKDLYATAGGIVNEVNLSNIPFISLVSDIVNEVTAVEFDLSVLEVITPNVGEVITVGDTKGPPIADASLFTGDVASLGEISKEATIAATVAEAATGMLMESMLTRATFSITNMTSDPIPIYTVSEFDSIIPGIDKVKLMNQFINKLIYVLMPQITEGDLIGLEVMASIDILGDARISVLISGGIPTVFSIPAYADSLFTSVVSDAQMHTNSMSEYENLTSLVLN